MVTEVVTFTVGTTTRCRYIISYSISARCTTDDGVISPVELLMVNPAGALNVPPVYAFVPVNVTGTEATVVQKMVFLHMK